MGQLLIDADKAKLIAKAAAQGWKCYAREPLTFGRDDRGITIEYSSAGIPSKATWWGGDEFPVLDGGHFRYSDMDDWFAWRP
jgi:hypothetical protein